MFQINACFLVCIHLKYLLKNLIILEIRDLINFATKIFLVTSIHTRGTVVEKTLRFKNIETRVTYIDQKHLMHDGDDVVSTGYLIEYYDQLSGKKT